MLCGNGLNNKDDSREGIEKYLKRNPSTSFVAVDGEKIQSKFFMSPGYLVDEIKKFEGCESVRSCETSTTIRYYGEV